MSENAETDRLFQAIEETNDLLEEGIEMANQSASHGEMRPSTHIAFKKMEVAMATLADVDPTRESNPEGMRCAECEEKHNDWEKLGEGAVDDGHHSGHITRVKCGECGAVDEVARP